MKIESFAVRASLIWHDEAFRVLMSLRSKRDLSLSFELGRNLILRFRILKLRVRRVMRLGIGLFLKKLQLCARTCSVLLLESLKSLRQNLATQLFEFIRLWGSLTLENKVLRSE